MSIYQLQTMSRLKRMVDTDKALDYYQRFLTREYENSANGPLNEILQSFLQERMKKLRTSFMHYRTPSEFVTSEDVYYAVALGDFIENSLYDLDLKHYEKELSFPLIMRYMFYNQRYLIEPIEKVSDTELFVQGFLFTLCEFIHIVYGEYKSVNRWE